MVCFGAAHPAMMKAPETRIGFLPALSTQMTAGMVARNMLSADISRLSFTEE